MSDALEVLGRRVRDARTLRGWNQERLAEAAGVSEGTVSSLEQGSRATQPAKVAAVMAALNMDTSSTASSVPEDVKLVVDVVAMWLMGIPAGDERAAAVLGLIRHLGSPADPAPATSGLRTTARGFTGKSPQVEGTKTRQDH